jgi:hypothetical protein
MEMFNVNRRDILNFDNYMDLKKPGFGGPASARQLKDARGRRVNPNPKLKEYQRVVERDPMFSHPHYNSTYKAMTHDLVYKQEGKKPFTYRDPYLTAVPTVEYDFANEGRSYESFEQFINESEEGEMMQAEPNAAATVLPIRGKSDNEAIGDAEEKLMAAQVDWDDLVQTKQDKQTGRLRVDFIDADGDLVAYMDHRTLHIMPEAMGTLSKEKLDYYMTPSDDMMQRTKYAEKYGPEEEEEPEMASVLDTEDEEEDSWEKPSAEEMEEVPEEKPAVLAKSEEEDIEEIERRLKAFERGYEGEEED